MTPLTTLAPASVDALVEALESYARYDKVMGVVIDHDKAKTLIEDFISRYNSGRAAV